MRIIRHNFTQTETCALNVFFRNLVQFPIFPLENYNPARLSLRLLGAN